MGYKLSQTLPVSEVIFQPQGEQCPGVVQVFGACSRDHVVYDMLEPAVAEEEPAMIFLQISYHNPPEEPNVKVTFNNSYSCC